MDKIKLVEESIQKWENVLKGGKDLGASNCPLCKTFLYGQECKGCPIFSYTGAEGCENTPYYDWISHQNKNHSNREYYGIFCKECVQLCEKEIEFLEKVKKAEMKKRTYKVGDEFKYQINKDSSTILKIVRISYDYITLIDLKGSLFWGKDSITRVNDVNNITREELIKCANKHCFVSMELI